MRCFLGGLTLGVHKIPFRVFSSYTPRGPWEPRLFPNDSKTQAPATRTRRVSRLNNFFSNCQYPSGFGFWASASGSAWKARRAWVRTSGLPRCSAGSPRPAGKPHPVLLIHNHGWARQVARHRASQKQDKRASQHYLGHRNIQRTTRYTELAAHRFKDFSGAIRPRRMLPWPASPRSCTSTSS
jgi:integrase